MTDLRTANNITNGNGSRSTNTVATCRSTTSVQSQMYVTW